METNIKHMQTRYVNPSNHTTNRIGICVYVFLAGAEKGWEAAANKRYLSFQNSEKHPHLICEKFSSYCGKQ